LSTSILPSLNFLLPRFTNGNSVKLESIYRAANIISNICVYASPTRSKPIAIVIPDPKLLSALASTNNIHPRPHEQLVHEPDVRELVLKELQSVGRKAGLAAFEIIEGVVLTDGEWSSMNVSSESNENGRAGTVEEKVRS
jgi:long-subunit acyl-CoA synthetase (AMP-forming)